MTRSLKITLLIIFLFQLLVSASFELAHDEAYYWLYSRHLDWGYFDHPPFVAFLIKLFSWLPHSEFSVRLGFVLLQLACLLILISLTGFPFLTTLLFFSFPLASFAGILALPDMPLLFMTAVYFWMVKKYFSHDSAKNSILLGVSISLLFYAKYHGVLLIFFTLVASPKLVFRKSFYLVAATAMMGFFPHVWWQYKHEFATLKYHFFERPKSEFSLVRSAEYLGLQLLLGGALAGPVVWFSALRGKAQDAFHRTLKLVCTGTVVFFLFSTFSKKVEANWTIFLAVPLILLATQGLVWEKRWARGLLVFSFVTIFAARLLFLIPSEASGISRLTEFRGWKLWATDVKYVCGEGPILANTYQIAAKLSFYLKREIGSLNYHSRKNQFDYWQFEKNIPTKDVCYVTNQREFQGIPVKTPEGKTLQIVKKQSLGQLWELKSKER